MTSVHHTSILSIHSLFLRALVPFTVSLLAYHHHQGHDHSFDQALTEQQFSYFGGDHLRTRIVIGRHQVIRTIRAYASLKVLRCCSSPVSQRFTLWYTPRSLPRYRHPYQNSRNAILHTYTATLISFSTLQHRLRFSSYQHGLSAAETGAWMPSGH